MADFYGIGFIEIVQENNLTAGCILARCWVFKLHCK